MIGFQPEPEFDDQQRDWFLSLSEYRAGLCPICGNPKDVCQAGANEDRFTVPPPSRCHASTAIRRARQSTDYEHPEALVFSAELPTT